MLLLFGFQNETLSKERKVERYLLGSHVLTSFFHANTLKQKQWIGTQVKATDTKGICFTDLLLV